MCIIAKGAFNFSFCCRWITCTALVAMIMKVKHGIIENKNKLENLGAGRFKCEKFFICFQEPFTHNLLWNVLYRE